MNNNSKFVLLVTTLIISIIFFAGCTQLENPTNVENKEINPFDLTQNDINQEVDRLKMFNGTQSTLASSQGGSGCPSYERSIVVSPKNNQDVTSPVKLKWTKCTPPNCYIFYRYYPHVYNSQDELVAVETISNQNTVEWSVSLDPGEYSWNILAKWHNGVYGEWGPSEGYFEVVAALQVSVIIGPNPANRSSNPEYYVNVSGGTGTYSYTWKVYNCLGQTVGTFNTETLQYSQFAPVAAGSYTLKVWITSGSQSKSKERSINLL
jgi:hypothetical protein